ncbi:MAG: hypothetical protein AB7I38_02190 [Dehalococcoidia bacterium]
MRIQAGRLIPLGYGRYVRSDDVAAIEPVTEGRGPQRRALVWVRGVPVPLVASRSEAALAADLAAVEQQRLRTDELRSMLRQMTEALDEETRAA